jgi:hypothetical protein
MVERPIDLYSEAFHVNRDRALARMARAGEPERRRRPWRAYAIIAAAAALILLITAGLGPLSRLGATKASLQVSVQQGTARQLIGGTRAEISRHEPASIAAVGELETGPNSRATINTAEGLKIELGDQTRVDLGAVQAKAAQLELLRGAVRCTVARRDATYSFRVVASDVTVVDLGTVFSVRIDDVARTTHVSVEQGAVMVHHASGQLRVEAPNVWTNAVPSAVPLPVVDMPEPSSSKPREGSSTAAKNAVSSTVQSQLHRAQRPRATLEKEAQLLRQGLAAERQGQDSEAASALLQLISQYPDSPLAPDARAVLKRVEARKRP